MTGAPPLRFLVLVVGGWVCVRAAMLAPEWVAEVERLQPRAPQASAATPVHPPSVRPERSRGTLETPFRLSRVSAALDGVSRLRSTRTGGELVRDSSPQVPAVGQSVSVPIATSLPSDVALPVPASLLQTLPGASRWSGSAWAFVRQGSEPALAAGSMLGGSQAGARIGYRINGDAERPLSIVGRAYAPLSSRRGSEAALSLEWKPAARLPVRVLAERRQAVGSEGRSAFAVMAHGGVSDVALSGGVRLEAYVQAGMVGAKSRDAFADATVALALPLDEERRLTIGAAVWGAAQPGISRVDAGPRLSLALPGAERVRVVADWRFRLAGDALPASGPSLTLATDF